MERRSDTWCRLLATFRAVHGGIRHDLLNIPAYGRSLFDPDRFPFLEGETARREVLDGLLLLNHERYAEEVVQGLQYKGKKKGKSGGNKKAKTQVWPEQTSLF